MWKYLLSIQTGNYINKHSITLNALNGLKKGKIEQIVTVKKQCKIKTKPEQCSRKLNSTQPLPVCFENKKNIYSRWEITFQLC